MKIISILISFLCLTNLALANTCQVPETCMDFWENYRQSPNQCTIARNPDEKNCKDYQECILAAVAFNKRQYCNDEKWVKEEKAKLNAAKAKAMLWQTVREYLRDNLNNLKDAKAYLINHPGHSYKVERVARTCGHSVPSNPDLPAGCTPLVEMTFTNAQSVDVELTWTLQALQKFSAKETNMQQQVKDQEDKLQEILDLLAKAGKIFSDMDNL